MYNRNSNIEGGFQLKKLFALFLALCMLLSLCACGGSPLPIPSTAGNETKAPDVTKAPDTAPATEPIVETDEPTEAPTEPAYVPSEKLEIVYDKVPTKWTLTELGPVSDGEATLTTRSDDLLVRYERDENDQVRYIPVDHMGKALTDVRYGYVEQLTSDLFIVSAVVDDVNNNGLMTETGELLIPCETAIIKPVSCAYDSDDSSRFLLVVYATEETTNEAEAFFYSSNSFFSIRPEEGDKFYKGYGKIYDTEKRQFVPELTITNPDRYDTQCGGANIYITTVDDENIVYNADGKEVFSSSDSSYLQMGSAFYIVDYQDVYDPDGNLMYHSDDTLQLINGSGQFLMVRNYTQEGVTVTDFYGNPLFTTQEVSTFSSEANGYFSSSVSSEKGILFNAEGEIVASVDGAYTPAYEGFGIWRFSFSDSEKNANYYLVNGATVVSSERSAYNLVNELKEEGSEGKSFFPWNNPTEKITVDCSYFTTVCPGLFIANGKTKALVDCFSGETLLTADRLSFANEKYIYATVDGVTTVYELNLE